MSAIHELNLCVWPYVEVFWCVKMLIASARMRNMCFCFHSSTMCCIVQSISVVEAVLYFHYASTVYLRICNLLLVICVSFTVIDAKW
jgi:hypothetical protein